jgi:hypothetical protein
MSRLFSSADGVAYSSTITEWSTVRSTGIAGPTDAGSPPSSATASRIPAKSASAGRHVVSCSMIRFGWIGISQSGPSPAARLNAAGSTSGALRATFSSRIRAAYGIAASRSGGSSADSGTYRYEREPTGSSASATWEDVEIMT